MQICRFWICVYVRKNRFIKICDIDSRGLKMLWDKKNKRIDLLNLSDSEKAEVIKKIRLRLQERIDTERGLRALLEAETIVVEGNVVYDANEPLRGITLPRRL